jgi:hypothetical protein
MTEVFPFNAAAEKGFAFADVSELMITAVVKSIAATTANNRMTNI